MTGSRDPTALAMPSVPASDLVHGRAEKEDQQQRADGRRHVRCPVVDVKVPDLRMRQCWICINTHTCCYALHLLLGDARCDELAAEDSLHRGCSQASVKAHAPARDIAGRRPECSAPRRSPASAPSEPPGDVLLTELLGCRTTVATGSQHVSTQTPWAALFLS